MEDEMEIFELLNSSIDDTRVVEYLEGLDHEAAFVVIEDEIQWRSRAVGLEIYIFGDIRRVKRVVVHSGTGESGAYTGRLPEGIDLSMSRLDFRGHFGRPETTSKNHDFWEIDRFPWNGFAVVYTEEEGVEKLVFSS
jgi:hypothetical protein